MKRLKNLFNSHVNFDLFTVDKGHHKVTYRGVKTIK